MALSPRRVVEGEPLGGPTLAARHAHTLLAVVPDGAALRHRDRVRAARALTVALLYRAAALPEGAADGVRARERHDALVVEAHPTRDNDQKHVISISHYIDILYVYHLYTTYHISYMHQPLNILDMDG